jgi:hypothetical protein
VRIASAIRRNPALKVELLGLKDARERFLDASKALARDQGMIRWYTAKRAEQAVLEGFKRAGSVAITSVKSEARGKGWPERLISAMFSRVNENWQERRRGVNIAGLIGVRTGRKSREVGTKARPGIWVEWRSRGAFTNIRATRKGIIRGAERAAGTLLGMSLARIMESGTVRTRASGYGPRPAFLAGVMRSQKQMVADVTRAYELAIEALNR